MAKSTSKDIIIIIDVLNEDNKENVNNKSRESANGRDDGSDNC